MSGIAIWEALEKDGWAEVQRWIDERVPESLHLEFKDLAGGQLDDRALTMVAKEFSAFANVEGGLLALGVTAKDSHTKNEPDRAEEAKGLANFNTSVAQLQNRLATLTDPAIPGIRLKTLPLPSDPQRAVIALLVPPSEGGPHRVTVNGDARDRYYMRTESNAWIAPHSILAQMFGSTARPRLRLAVARGVNDRCTLFIRNDGRGMAQHVLIRATIRREEPNKNLIVNPTNEGWGLLSPTSVRGSPFYVQGFLGSAPVHAHDIQRVTTFDVVEPFETLLISARIDAQNSAPIEICTSVDLKGGHLVIVPAKGDDGEDPFPPWTA